MDYDSRSRSAGSRSGSRRNQQRSPAEWKGVVSQESRKQGQGSNLAVSSHRGKSPNSRYNSSSEEEGDARQAGFIAPLKLGERSGSGRARVTPSDLVTQGSTPSGQNDLSGPGAALDLNERPPSDPLTPPSGRVDMTHIPHYYQELPQGHYVAAPHHDEYESPATKGGHRGGPKPPMSGGRNNRIGTGQGSSLSSSDNNSDTTYAESDVNSSLRARMAALDNGIGTPPDPAPPEVPPRGPSHHHPLLTGSRRGPSQQGMNNATSPHYQEAGDDGYQQPTGNVFLSQEYLMSGASPRYTGTGGGKSPGNPALYGPSPTRDYIPSDFSQPRMIGTYDTQKGCLTSTGAIPGGVGLTSLPSVRNNLTLGSRGSFSSRGLNLGKTWRERCSWKIAAIALIILCAILAALLAYFAANFATSEGRTKGCILVEDAAKVIAAGSSSKDDETTISYPTPAFTLPISTSKPEIPSVKDQGGGTEVTRLQALNRRYSNKVSPQGYWNIQFVVKQPMFMRFNLSVPRSSQLAFFGRRNVAPSITQYDFVEFIRSGRLGRAKRNVRRSSFYTKIPNLADPLPPSLEEIHNQATNPLLDEDYIDDWNDDYEDELVEKSDKDDQKIENVRDDSEKDELYYYYDYDLDTDIVADGAKTKEKSSVEEGDKANIVEERATRSKRYLSEREVNVSIVEYLDTGMWYLSIYNDGLGFNQVSLLVEEAPELQSACPNDCSGRGPCVLGECECMQGWIGKDCSKSVCPVLCSSHGTYGGGLCHCETGWKGRECDVPLSDCDVPDCSGHGNCISGTCRCSTGWKGDACDKVDCRDSTCGNHGWCLDGTCICRAGWTGSNCTEVDHKVFTCLPNCSGNGHYDLHSSECICDAFWTGKDCSEARCSLECIHGLCDGGVCSCEEGWTGQRCEERSCDSRCKLHGQCHNGTCLCVQGMNGRHCTIPGCVNGCSGHGLCTTDEGIYQCACSAGWTGQDCSVALEMKCNDDEDNDGDSLIDCNDSDCCSTPECRDHVMCMVSSDPVEVLLRKQPPAVTASFYQRVKFIIEDTNVQSFARKDEFHESRVSVIRGRVITPQGQGIVGVRTSVEKETKFGLTATRKGGWFDVLVNGGGAVTLQFQRAHFEPRTVTVPVLWNKIVVIEPVVMWLKDQVKEVDSEEYENRWSEPCLDHDHKLMKPQAISTFLPHAVGNAPDSSVVFTESQIIQESLRIPGSELHLIYHSSSVAGYLSSLLLQLTPEHISKTLSMVHLKITLEGIVFEKLFEADPNMTYTFTWNKRNVYKQKVYGEATAIISVGYEYLTCNKIIWESQTAKLHGFHMDISDVGGWNLDIHHMYNFEAGLLQRGDGSTLSLKNTPSLVKSSMGTGKQRSLSCNRQCEGTAREASLLTPSSLASGPDGSIYVGDFNLIRRITPEGMVHTILQLSSTQVSYGYYLAVSPADGQVYMSDPEKYRVIRLLSIVNVTDPLNNSEVVVGNGERCIPGDERHCGDHLPAGKARLSHPKGIAISADKTMYICDGTNIRMVDPLGVIHTLIGHHGHKNRWKPLPCQGGIPANQVELQWPTDIALSTLDDSLHILDDHVVLQVTADGNVRVKAGTPIHCRSTEEQPYIGTITGLAFAPNGVLYLSEQSGSKRYSLLQVSPSGKISIFAGKDCHCTGISCECSHQSSSPKSSLVDPDQKEVKLSTTVVLGQISGITVSADGIVHVADQEALQILSFNHYLPEDDRNGDYQVAFPKTNELYVFNRHGHHVETRDLVTGRTLYSFLYSKNTSFGRLSKVTDSSGNKVIFLRDYKSSVNQVENTAGEKFKVEISRLGLMTKFSERPERHYDFTYDDDTGLLLAATTPGRLTTIYEYDRAGRLQTVVSPTGNRLALDSWMGGNGSRRHLAVGVGSSQRDQQTGHVLSLINDNKATFTHGEVEGTLETWPNGTWDQSYPWGGKSSATSVSTNPLLESILPTQAKLLPVALEYTISNTDPKGGDVSSNQMVTSYGVLEDRRRGERLVEKILLVNGSRVLSRQWKGAERTELFTDGAQDPILQVSYNGNGKPISILLGRDLTSLNLTYDRFDRLGSRHWERMGEEYDYNSDGLLSAITTKTSALTRYAFGTSRLLETITLPSGRTWSYRYDKRGGLKFITTPSGTFHGFTMQPSFGAYVFSYVPPGGSHAYRQHLDQDGRLTLTVFPESSAKVLYRYTQAGQLKEIISGDGKTQFYYENNALISEIIHEESELDYKMDFLYKGRLNSEHRIDYGARTGLSNVKFIYDYDSNFRPLSIGGRIGGQNLKLLEYEYSRVSGVPSKIGDFTISRPSKNETVIHDLTAIFSRKTDSHFKVTQLSVTIHQMEVFRMDIIYRRDGKIAQTNTYTRNFHSKPYTNTKNFTYDPDGQLISAEAKEPWKFSYDANGNMLSLTYSTNTIPMKYDDQDRIMKFGEGGYKYNSRGAIVQNVREVNYRYNARGMLIRASKAGRFIVDYFYDHENRLIARKDNFGNVTQFLYADQQHKDLVTHIYNPRDGNLITLVYDDRGHIIFAQVHRNKYYIATDECGTPIMIFNQYGEVVREVMRSPYGHSIYDSNPYLYLPIDYCGGILETKTELVHMPGGRVYDPLIGLWLTPSWESIPENLMSPEKLSLYRFNSNDPINLKLKSWRNFGHEKWLSLMDYDLSGTLPQLSPQSLQSPMGHETHNDLWTSFTKVDLRDSRANWSPFKTQVGGPHCVSGFVQNHKEAQRASWRLSVMGESKLRKDFDPDSHKFDFSIVPGPFGEGILVSTVNGRAILSVTPQANPIFRDVLMSVFNSSQLLDVVLTAHNSYVFFFVKESYWKASEDMTQLNRLAGEVNITVHEPSDEDRGEKVMDIKLHSSSSAIHIRYGTMPQQERRRLLKHAKKLAIRRSWADERSRVHFGLPGSIDWTPSEVEELLNRGSVSSYTARYLHPPEEYPALLDDPSNIRFYKDAKRTRRNSKSRKSRRCRRKWWRVIC